MYSSSMGLTRETSSVAELEVAWGALLMRKGAPGLVSRSYRVTLKRRR